MVMRRLDQVLADVLTSLGIVAGSAQGEDSAHPPRLAREDTPAGCEIRKSAEAEAPASCSGGQNFGDMHHMRLANDNRANLKGPAPCTLHRSRHTVAPNAR